MKNQPAEKPGRGRPASFAKDKLIADVTELFWRCGFHTLSLNTIAQKMGLKRSSLYNTFKTKEGLFTECLAHYRAHSPTKCLEDYQAGQKVGPLLHNLFDDICTLRAADPERRGCLMTNTLNELAGSKTALAQTLKQQNQARHQKVCAIIEAAIAQKELAEDSDPAILAKVILSFMAGLNLHAKSGCSQEELQQMSTLFLQAIGFKNTAKSAS